MERSLSIRCIEGLEAILEQAEPWQALARRRARSRPFAGPGFVTAALSAYHQGDAPVLYWVEQDGEPQGALPLIRRPIRRSGLSVHEIGFPRNPHTLVNDPLLPDDPSAAGVILEALLVRLATDDCDTVMFDHVPDDAGLVTILEDRARHLGYSVETVDTGRDLQFATLSGDFDAYLASRSSDHRWQLKKLLRKARDADVSIERIEGRDAIRNALPAWRTIEQASWQGASADAAMAAVDDAFTRGLLDRLAEDEVGELWMLSVRDVPAAALRMLGGDCRLSVHTMHFDQRHKGLTPGTLLVEAMMRSAFERGLAEVDFHGDSTFFRRWATGLRAHRSVRLYRPGLYGRLLHGGRTLARRVEAWRKMRHEAEAGRSAA